MSKHVFEKLMAVAWDQAVTRAQACNPLRDNSAIWRERDMGFSITTSAMLLGLAIACVSSLAEAKSEPVQEIHGLWITECNDFTGYMACSVYSIAHEQGPSSQSKLTFSMFAYSQKQQVQAQILSDHDIDWANTRILYRYDTPEPQNGTTGLNGDTNVIPNMGQDELTCKYVIENGQSVTGHTGRGCTLNTMIFNDMILYRSGGTVQFTLVPSSGPPRIYRFPLDGYAPAVQELSHVIPQYLPAQ